MTAASAEEVRVPLEIVIVPLFSIIAILALLTLLTVWFSKSNIMFLFFGIVTYSEVSLNNLTVVATPVGAAVTASWIVP